MANKKKAKTNSGNTFQAKDGSFYKGERKGGKVRVFTTHTAPGQLELQGVFDPDTRKWHNDNKLPRDIKRQVEATFV